MFDENDAAANLRQIVLGVVVVGFMPLYNLYRNRMNHQLNNPRNQALTNVVVTNTDRLDNKPKNS